MLFRPRNDHRLHYRRNLHDDSFLYHEHTLGGVAMDLSITDLERFTIELPFREVPARNMIRELPDFTFFEIFRVSLGNGIVGTGETMHFYYPWGETTDATVERIRGRNAYETMWDDTIGQGLQMALFDAVGKALQVPMHALLGEKVRDRAHLSWWMIDMPPEDWANECEAALRLGYRDLKAKGRPWYDIYAQMDAIQKVVPENFRIDLDFNDTLLDADHAIPILQRLKATYRNLAICEGPLDDVENSKRLRAAVEMPIVQHAGLTSLGEQIRDDYCDGFVVGGCVSSILHQGTVCAAFDKPFWLQQVGSGLTAAFSMHLAAVLSHATWPAIICHHIYDRDVLATPIEVCDGTSLISDAPGLGVEIDEDAMDALRFRGQYQGFNPARLIEVAWPDGARFYYSSGNQLWRDAQAGNMPVFIAGVQTRIVPDDGSACWRKLHARASEAPVREKT